MPTLLHCNKCAAGEVKEWETTYIRQVFIVTIALLLLCGAAIEPRGDLLAVLPGILKVTKALFLLEVAAAAHGNGGRDGSGGWCSGRGARGGAHGEGAARNRYGCCESSCCGLHDGTAGYDGMRHVTGRNGGRGCWRQFRKRR